MGGVPPLTDTFADPSLNPKQLISVESKTIEKLGGGLMVTLPVAVQDPVKSVTVTLYTPSEAPVTISAFTGKPADDPPVQL